MVDLLVTAFFCSRPSCKQNLDALRVEMGKEKFESILASLEKMQIIEYPMVQPTVYPDFPRGIPYRGTKFFLVSFVFYPAWIKAYMNNLKDLKRLLTDMNVSDSIIEASRSKVAAIDQAYAETLEAQRDEISSWSLENRKVITQLLDPAYKRAITFSKFTRLMESA
jgi:hypothetical protein